MYVRQVKRHNLSTMGFLYIFIALVIQGSLTFANTTNSEELFNSGEILYDRAEIDDEIIKDFHTAKQDWIDFLPLPDGHLYPTTSVAMMTQATNSDKPVEEQLEEIKEIAQKITLAIQSEMANLLSYALSTCDKEEIDEGDNKLRKKRSSESPMASTQLVTRLLKHIKSNNEYQNIAIDKMMTAQEIADKYGIEFSPDTEILSDLAFAANEQAKEMNTLLQDSIEMKNVSQRVEYVPIEATKEKQNNNSNYVYAVPPEPQSQPKEHTPSAQPVVNHHHYTDSYPNYNYYYNYPYETQVPPPMQTYYSPPVSKRPDFYDAVSFVPQEYPYCSVEPVASSTSVILPYEKPIEPEAELAGEEYEETITSKVYVDRGDEPGSATVNHVMTYTVAEKSHFRTPEIERLPQQMQYCFFLM